MTPSAVYPLDDVAGLPNIKVVFPGEHWSDGKASEVIVPGEAIVQIASGGKKYWRVAEAADLKEDVFFALRCIEHPDVNNGPGQLGPNEIVNTAMQPHEWVHSYYSGEFALTLFTPAAYLPGDKLGWDVDGVRPAGKGGAGAWAKNASADIDDILVVEEFIPVNALNEGILIVRPRGRGQF